MSTLPLGFVAAWPTASALPASWLACDGSAVSRAAYAALFAAIGTTNGAGDGATTFNLPNPPGKFIPGAAGTYAPADTGGSANLGVGAHTHLPPYANTDRQSVHRHHGPGNTGASDFSETTGSTIAALVAGFGVNASTAFTGAGHTHTFFGDLSADNSPSGGPASHQHGISGTYASSSESDDQLPPWFAVTFIIRAL